MKKERSKGPKTIAGFRNKVSRLSAQIRELNAYIIRLQDKNRELSDRYCQNREELERACNTVVHLAKKGVKFDSRFMGLTTGMKS